MKVRFYIFSTLLLASIFSFAQPKIKLDTFSRSYTSPVAIENDGSSSRLFVVGQTGLIFVLDSNGVKLDTFLDIRSRVQTSNEEGLLSMAFHPDYANNGYFYVYHTKKNTTDNAVFSSNPNRAFVDSQFLVLSISHPTFNNHNGGCLKFGNDGYLYISTGDGGGAGDIANNAQNKNILLGKILRINVNQFDTTYTIPTTNPFYNVANTKKEIWAYGLRNPWRYTFDRLTHDLWIGDVGQGNWEEIDFQAAGSTGGENYGWRCYEGNATYNTAGCSGIGNYKFPVFAYDHSSSGGIAVTGGFVYRGNKYGDLKGYYICADYGSANFWVIKKTDTVFTTTALGKPLSGANISAFGEDIRGELYASNVSNGVIYKIRELCSSFKINLVSLQHPSCPDTANGSIQLSSTGSNGSVSYSWSNGGNTNMISNLGPSKYIYTATDAIGCVRKDSFVLYNADTLDKPIITPNGNFLQTTAGFTYQWKWNGNIIAGSVLDTIHPSASGNYEVQITDINGCKAVSDAFSYIYTGIRNKNQDLENFSFYPNPVNDQLTIDIRFSSQKKFNLKIYNTIGQSVYEEKMQGKELVKTVSLKQLPKGIYELSVFTEEGKIVSATFIKE